MADLRRRFGGWLALTGFGVGKRITSLGLTIKHGRGWRA